MEESSASLSLKMMTLNNSGSALVLCMRSVPSTLAHLLHGKKDLYCVSPKQMSPQIKFP